MSSPSPPVLQQLYRLNGSSSGFHDQLSNVLYGKEYIQCLPNLEGDDLVWLVEYLDKVRFRVALPALRSSQRRHSMVLILPAPPPGSVYANSEVYAAPARYFQRRTRFHLTF